MTENPRRPTLFFSVGEPSGDLHAANLIRALAARRELAGMRGRAETCELDFVGLGGPKMAAAGCRLLTDLTALAVMGIFPVIVHLFTFLRLLLEADRFFRDERPDAVILVDYPGFNWWIARRAKARGIPVVYYVPPQLWAWAQFRVSKMRRLVDHVLCALPFEADWFREQGCRATFVGHPYYDELAAQKLDQSFMQAARGDGRLVTILPGSRGHEVRHNLPWFLKAAKRIQQRVPSARFAIASFKESQGETARRLVAESGVAAEVYVGRTPELIAAGDCCLAVSGSVSLELLWHRRPTAILYFSDRLTGLIARLMVRVRYMTLVNLLATEQRFAFLPKVYDPRAPGAERIPFPEYPTCSDKSPELADHIVEWLTNEPKRQAKIAQLGELKTGLAHGGASKRAAEYILDLLAARHAEAATTRHERAPAPHFTDAARRVREKP